MKYTRKELDELSMPEWLRVLKQPDIDLYDVCKDCKCTGNECCGNHSWCEYTEEQK